MQPLLHEDINPLFKAKPEVVCDKLFKAILEGNMLIRSNVKQNSNIPVLIWWEGIV